MYSRRRPPLSTDPRVREALVGEAVTTEMGLFINLGGDPDAHPGHLARALTWCARQLEAHGYERRYVRIGSTVAAKQVVRWVRLERWPEDARFDWADEDCPEWIVRGTTAYL
jgi:Uma2 family endonuclease